MASSSKMTDAQIMDAIVKIKEVLSALDDPGDRASVCFEVGLENACLALQDAGKDVTDQALLAMSHAMVAGFILSVEQGQRKLSS